MASAAQRIAVTGGNAGIGLALCEQLVLEHGCHVYLGSRSADRGQAAVDAIAKQIPAGATGSVELLVVDVGQDASVAAAASAVQASLGGDKLYALVNNAGVGWSQATGPDDVVNTNLLGTKRMCAAFVPMIAGRIVNVGSGSAGGYVSRVAGARQAALCTPPANWQAIEAMLQKSEDNMTGLGSEADTNGAYGLSKALVASYTMLLANEHPAILSSCCTPGFIDTKLTAGFGASKTPAEGTVAIKHCLFNALGGNGWYFGSDAVRSPYHFMRNPGEPEYDGALP